MMQYIAVIVGIRLVRIQSFSGAAPGRSSGPWYMTAVRCPDYMTPLSVVPARSKGIQVVTFRDNLTAGVAGMISVLPANRLRVSALGFLLDLFPWPFQCLDMTASQRRF